jgi:hypothetical protein
MQYQLGISLIILVYLIDKDTLQKLYRSIPTIYVTAIRLTVTGIMQY